MRREAKSQLRQGSFGEAFRPAIASLAARVLPGFRRRCGALVHAETQLSRNQRLDAIEEKIVKPGASLAADLDGVFKTCGGNQSHARALALQQSVGADRGAVQKITAEPLGPICSRALTIACEGSSGVEKTFSRRRWPRSVQTQSVKVPPVSMATWNSCGVGAARHQRLIGKINTSDETRRFCGKGEYTKA